MNEKNIVSGISYIGIEVPPYVVTADVIAEREKVPKEKIEKGLLIKEFRFPGESDTIITLAANNLLKRIRLPAFLTAVRFERWTLPFEITIVKTRSLAPSRVSTSVITSVFVVPLLTMPLTYSLASSNWSKRVLATPPSTCTILNFKNTCI